MKKRSEIGKDRAGTPLLNLPAPGPAPAKPKPSSVGTVTCTDCGLEQPGGTSDCIACGKTLPEFKLNAGEPTKKHVVPEEENLGKLAYDLKNKDIDITLAQLCAMEPDDRRELQKWVDAKSADVLPRVRMILERLNELKTKPLAGPGSEPSDEIFKTDPQPVADRGMRVRMGIDMAKPGSKDETVTTMMKDGKIVPPSSIDSFASSRHTDEGEEVTFTHGKEMYRVTEFCTFDVGPFASTTRIRAGETRADAMWRLRTELEAVAEKDRIAKRDSYINTLLGIKPALKKASDSIKE